MNHEWMKDESLSKIDRNKLEFLQTLLFESSSLKKEQMLSFLVSVAKKGKNQNITFSDEEINMIIEVLKKQATPEELIKIEKISAFRSKKS